MGCTTDMETLFQDYYKPVSEMKDKELWMSTLTEGSRPKSFGDNKICLLCGFQYYFSVYGCDRRNRVGHQLVECLVRTHTNLQFEHRLEMYETGQLSWDIEMVVQEPLSDDEDGVPHCSVVLVSESESENDSD